MHLIRSLLWCIFCGWALPVCAEMPFQPADEASFNPEFLTFRNSVLKSIERRDADAIEAIASSDIRHSFGDLKEGSAAFRASSLLDDPHSNFWRDFEQVLTLGGRFDEAGIFTAPYVFTDWPDNVPTFDYMAVVGNNVRVRTAPNAKADIITTLDHCLVQSVQPSGTNGEWYQVRLQDGRDGHINAQYLRSPIDYRATFQAINGQWKMIFFIAGD